jgi:hypothetical protein
MEIRAFAVLQMRGQPLQQSGQLESTISVGRESAGFRSIFELVHAPNRHHDARPDSTSPILDQEVMRNNDGEAALPEHGRIMRRSVKNPNSFYAMQCANNRSVIDAAIERSVIKADDKAILSLLDSM